MKELIAQLRAITDRDALDRWADSHIKELYEHTELRLILRKKRDELRNIANTHALAMSYINN